MGTVKPTPFPPPQNGHGQHGQVPIVGQHRLGIVVPTGERAREPDFYDCLDALEKPQGTVMARAHGQSPARNRNAGIAYCLANGCTHILFLDDDVVFPPDILRRLMQHAHLDIVSGLILKREYPHIPTLFRTSLGANKYEPFLLGPDDHGLVEAANAGLGCVLIRAEVFRAIEQPWIRLGEFEADLWSDDTGFMQRAAKAGFRIWCDLDIWIGHHANLVVWPGKTDGQWTVTIQGINSKHGIVIPVIGAPDPEPALAIQ